MIKHIKLTSAAALLAVGLFSASNVSAAPLTGGITFDGTIAQSFHSGTTTITLKGPVTDIVGMGSFAGATSVTLTGSPVTLVVGAGSDTFTGSVDLFSVKLGGATVTFDLTSLTLVQLPGKDTFFSGGSGDFIENGVVTPGTFALNDTQKVGQAGATSLTAVPDGGTTAVLLGAGILGLALMKRVLGGLLA